MEKMAERFMPIGQFVPGTVRINQGRIPSTYATRISGESNSLSFHEVMEKTPAKITPVNENLSTDSGNTNISSTTASGTPFNVQTAIQEGWTVVPARQSDFNQQLTAPAAGNLPVDARTYSETNQLLQNMPLNYPQGEQLADLMLRNMREYQESKAARLSHTAQPESKPGTSYPLGLEARIRSDSTQPLDSLPYENELTSGLSGPNDSTPATMNSNTGAKAHGPSKWTLPDSNSTQFPSGNLVEKDTTREQSIQSPRQEDQNPERKGFFQNLGSIFGDLASGLTLGFFRPRNEPVSHGVERVLYPLRKLVFDVPFKDVAVGIPAGIYHDTGRVFSQPPKQDALITNSDTSTPADTLRSTPRRRFSSHVSVHDRSHPQRAFRRNTEV